MRVQSTQKNRFAYTKSSMSTLPNISKLTLGPILTTTKGSKQIQISKDDGSPVIWTPSEYLEVAFEPSNFSDKESSRLSICFAPTEEIINNFQGIFETWCIKTLAKKSQELLGSQQTAEQIKETFQSCVKTSEKGWTSFRCKMNVAGKNAIQCWTPERVKCSQPNSWRDCKLKPQLHLKSMYLMNKEVGLIIEIKNALIEEIEPECPFE